MNPGLAWSDIDDRLVQHRKARNRIWPAGP
jgi:hypothetical protein